MEQCSICLESLRRVVPTAPAPPVPRGAGNPLGEKSVEMRRVGDAEWRWFGSRKDAAKAFGIGGSDVTRLIDNPSNVRAPCRSIEARPAPPRKRERPTKKKAGGAPRSKRLCVEGAAQKVNGKWSNSVMFPGREFDDLDAYRAAKKQCAARKYF